MKCAPEHATDACTSNIIKCHYCRGDHYTGSPKCKKQIEEKEILAIQTLKKVSRTEARTIMYKDNPFRLNFSEAVKTSAESKKKKVK